MSAVAPGKGPSRVGRPRDPRVEGRVNQAVLEIVAERGLAGLTVAEVAQRAGVGKASIYRRWSSKEAVLLAAWQALVVDPPEVDTGSLTSDLRAIFGVIAEDFRSPTIRAVVPHLIAAARVDPDAARAFRDVDQGRRLAVTVAFQRAQARGEIRPELDVTVLEQVLSAFTISQVALYDRLLTEDAIDQVVELVVRGAAPEERPASSRPTSVAGEHQSSQGGK
jgi:AcrR family transcriptional regulator